LSKTFGDLNPEADVELLPWVDIDPHYLSLVAWCRVAVNACYSSLSDFLWTRLRRTYLGGKILLEQKQAVQQWDKLLQACLPKGRC